MISFLNLIMEKSCNALLLRSGMIMDNALAHSIVIHFYPSAPKA